MLFYRLYCRWLPMPFGVVADDYPILRTDFMQPLVIFQTLAESLPLMPPDLKRAGQFNQRLGDSFPEAPVKIQDQ